MATRILENEVNLICEKYLSGKYSVSSLSKELGRNDKSITKILKNNNISIDKTKCGRDFTINHHYFDIIDTEEKAYFLGLLYADGCNLKQKSIIKIGLQERDKNILEKLSIAIESNRPLGFEKLSKKHNTWKNVYVFRVNSRNMCNSLERLGCVPRKSLILKFPTEEQVPSYLIRHFIRGYFDGDGSVSYTMGGRCGTSIILQVNIISTIYFLSELYDVLQKELNIHTTIHHDKRVLDKPTRMMFMTSNVAKKFLNWIYDNSNIFLDRKFNKYKEIERKINDNRTNDAAKV